MKKPNFLISTIKKALNKPKTTLFNDLILCYRSSHSGFIFADKSECNFAPYFLKNTDINNLLHKYKQDITRNEALKLETETFNHYFSENIFIKERTKKTEDMRKKFDLHALNRQSAQIRCLSASIFPADFSEKFSTATEKFIMLQNKTAQYLKKNENAVKTALIDDFSQSCKKIMRRFCLWDMLCPQNKKILQHRLQDIIKILTENQTLPADFSDGNIFKTPVFSFEYGKNYRAEYADYLLYLSEKIILMRKYPDLLKLALAQTNESKDFAEELRYFHNANYSPNLDDIVKIRNLAQSFYEKFAKICYLNSVIKSFEIFYIKDNPLEQNSALPSVDSQKELEKMERIIARSKSIKAKGNLAKEYTRSLNNFEQSADLLQTALNNFKNIG